MVCSDEGTYLYNFGGVVYEEVEGKTIYTIRITNDDTSPYTDILAAYDEVWFEHAEYSLTQLEVIGNLFIAAHPEMAEYMSVYVPFDSNAAYIFIRGEATYKYDQLIADADGLPIKVMSDLVQHNDAVY